MRVEILFGETEGGHDGIRHAGARIGEVIHQPRVIADQAFVAEVGCDAAIAIVQFVAGGAGAIGDQLFAGLFARGSRRDHHGDVFNVGLVAIERGLGEIDAAPALQEDHQGAYVGLRQVELRHEAGGQVGTGFDNGLPEVIDFELLAGLGEIGPQGALAHAIDLVAAIAVHGIEEFASAIDVGRAGEVLRRVALGAVGLHVFLAS